MCTQFRSKSKSSLQIYIVNFSSSERVVINAKDFRKELLEIHTPKLEKLYGITFDIKGATQLIQTTSESEPDHPNNNQQDNIRNGQDTSNIRNGKDTQNKNHQQNNTLEKNQTSDNNEHNEQYAKNQLFSNNTCNSNDDNKTATENTDNGLYEIPTNTKSVSPKHEGFKREIINEQSKAQKDFNNKIEKEQIKITEEINELKETFPGEVKKTCSELKSYCDNKEESMKLEIRNLQLQIEHLKKENIDLKSKAKILPFSFNLKLLKKLPESTKTQPNIKKLNKSIQEHNEAIKRINLQPKKKSSNYVRNTIERMENNLKYHKEKIKKQLNSDKAVDQKIKEILNTVESFQDNGNPWLTVGKKGKIIHDEETPANELQRKQPRSKKFELVTF